MPGSQYSWDRGVQGCWRVSFQFKEFSINSLLSRMVWLPSLQCPRCPLVLNPKHPAGMGDDSPGSMGPSWSSKQTALQGLHVKQSAWLYLQPNVATRPEPFPESVMEWWGLAGFSLLPPCTVFSLIQFYVIGCVLLPRQEPKFKMWNDEMKRKRALLGGKYN